MSAVRLGPVTRKRADELDVLADGLHVYYEHRKAEEASWAEMPGLPVAYRVGVKIIRTPFTEAIVAWEISARARARFLRTMRPTSPSNGTRR